MKFSKGRRKSRVPTPGPRQSRPRPPPRSKPAPGSRRGAIPAPRAWRRSKNLGNASAPDDYTEAKEAMFFLTDTADARWVVIKSDDKKRARLNCMQHFLTVLDYLNKDRRVIHGPDPLIVGASAQVIGRDKHIIGKSLDLDRKRKR